MRILAQIVKGLSRGSRTPVVSRAKFFVTRVKGWESLVADTKMSFLNTLGVLELPLCEIKMSRLHKLQISETGFY